MFLKEWLKYFINRLTSSKYVIKGECKKCGECCRTIMFLDEDNKYINTPEMFEQAKKRVKRLKNFDINGELKENGVITALLFKCKFLKDNGQCSHYWRRSLFCRDYPAINSDFIMRGGETLDTCGYYFETNKKFEEYLK